MDIDISTEIKEIDLGGKNLFKISHGKIANDKNFRKINFIQVLEEKAWICMGKNTSRGQGNHFIKKARVGDFVYVCYGGNKVKFIGKIIDDYSPVPTVYDIQFDGKGVWVYRPIEVLFNAIDEDVSSLKSEKKHFMPSGYSTFYQVPVQKLNFINEKLFIPKFGVSFNNKQEEAKPLSPVPIMNNHDKEINTILYGPPGTGKTYSTIDMALNITGESFDVDEDQLRSVQKGKFAELQKQRRIYFTTFHQNMSYEDFIEGIKPVKADDEDSFLKYEIQDGLFMQACIEAAYNYHVKNHKADHVVEQLLDFNVLYDLLFDEVSTGKIKEINTISNAALEISVTSQGNFVIVHKGRERTYTVSKDRLSKIYEAYPDPTTMTNIHENIRGVIGGSNSTAYWSVLNKIISYREKKNEKPTASTPKNLSYEDKKKVVHNVWEKRSNEIVSNDQSDPFVFIIDEINRGNVSQIFGELITLIEPDKRMGKEEVLYVDLPYSKKAFAVPPNLYIIGTMNTADRSVEALDTALRRRFSFKAKLPLPSQLTPTDDGIDLSAMLTKINERLRVLKDADHTIGHAWFWNVKNIEGLKSVYADKILPLLQEFFYNDYEKLGLVLGDSFFEGNRQVSADIFAKFSAENSLAGQYEQIWQYHLKDPIKLEVEDFQTLYKPLS